ncbi:ATP-binding cassette domain-containing protein [Microbacterium sp. KR10-403]|uniref:ABC transporter ATP-binding protein n=1 Tax=Microbacterium sp. KR10-403 TaxID=3158581 RepID=UPI0032E41774
MIVVDDAHVTYRVYASGKRVSGRDGLPSLRGALRGGRGLQTVPALRGVTFTASAGETIGVVGHNGSGKSTLFRAMSGLIPTSEGTIWAADRPVLLGVNAALVPELSGENNIKIGLLAMGFSQEEAAAQVDEIAEFAELNEFINHPMRTYSSGMGARLRFAIAAAKSHSILLIDEALAVGDRRFKQKSDKRLRELRDSAGLVMIVSHSSKSLRDTCERVLWIHKGELRADGPADDVIGEYLKWTKNPSSAAVGAASSAKPRAKTPTEPSDTALQRAASAAAMAAAQGGRARTIPVSKAESKPSLLDDLLGEVGLATTPIAIETPSQHVKDAGSGRPSSRDAERRGRYIASTRERHRRRLLTVLITGGAIVLAIAAGAGLALAANLSASPDPQRSNSVASVATDEPAPSLPVIGSFAAAAKTVECAADDAKAKVKLSWKVDHAALVAVVAGSVTAEKADLSPKTVLPTEMKDHAMAFGCDASKQAYTLVAENANGDRVSSVITVTRTEPTPTPVPSAPPQQTIPVAPQPAPVTTSKPVSTPAPSETAPSTAPSTEPSEPEPEPTPSSEPTTPGSTDPTSDPAPSAEAGG